VAEPATLQTQAGSLRDLNKKKERSKIRSFDKLD